MNLQKITLLLTAISTQLIGFAQSTSLMMDKKTTTKLNRKAIEEFMEGISLKTLTFRDEEDENLTLKFPEKVKYRKIHQQTRFYDARILFPNWPDPSTILIEADILASTSEKIGEVTIENKGKIAIKCDCNSIFEEKNQISAIGVRIDGDAGKGFYHVDFGKYSVSDKEIELDPFDLFPPKSLGSDWFQKEYCSKLRSIAPNGKIVAPADAY